MFNNWSRHHKTKPQDQDCDAVVVTVTIGGAFTPVKMNRTKEKIYCSASIKCEMLRFSCLRRCPGDQWCRG